MTTIAILVLILCSLLIGFVIGVVYQANKGQNYDDDF